MMLGETTKFFGVQSIALTVKGSVVENRLVRAVAVKKRL